MTKKFIIRSLVGVGVWTCVVGLSVVMQKEAFDLVVGVQLGIILAAIGEGVVSLGNWASKD
jgi:hypothetical protein